ncbi:MAG: FAD-dependent oxidoreductase [Planctomycetaceae bacterium]
MEMTAAQRRIVFEDAKQFSLGFLHYLQTEVHDAMPDPTHSFRRFELTDEFDTSDRCPPKPYIRESLRLKAMKMLVQQETTGFGGRSTDFATIMPHDGIACWQFEYDFHPTRREFLDEGRTDGPWTTAFRAGRTWGPPYSGRCLLPLRSLVPVEVNGLLGGQKNLGYSSIVSSALRLHDQSMAIGQAGGAIAAVALRHGKEPRELTYDRNLLCEVWGGLATRGDAADDAVEPVMLWPFRDLEPDATCFVAVQQLAARRMLPVGPARSTFDRTTRRLRSGCGPSASERRSNWRLKLISVSRAAK